MTTTDPALRAQQEAVRWFKANYPARWADALAALAAAEAAPPPEYGRPPLDPATKAHDDAYMAGLIRGRELEREAAEAAPLDGVTDDGRCSFCGGPWPFVPRKHPPRKTHCVNGHPLAGEPERRGGGRRCRICDRDQHRKRRALAATSREGE